MSPTTRLGRSVTLLQSRAEDRLRRSTKWIRDRRRERLVFPPPTAVKVERVVAGVLEIRLSAGDRRNVLGRATIDRIDEIVADPPHGTKVIVITAEPPDFCAGYDFIEASRGEAETLIAHEGNFAALRSSLLPIVVALHGNVIGGGLELALLADVRVASVETKFAIPASKLGLTYSENGVRLVVDAFGQSVARSMFLGGRVVTAEMALSMGVISEIVNREQLRVLTLELATSMAEWSPEASSGNRQILDVVAGRVVRDTDALHRASFASNGTLAQTIAAFTARRSAAIKKTSAPATSNEPQPT